MIFTIIAGAAVVINAYFVWPQAYKIFKTKNFSGVSVLTWLVSFIIFCAWSGYAYADQYWALMLANISSAVAAAVILLTHGLQQRTFKFVSLAFISAVVALTAAFLLPVFLLPIVLVSGPLMRLPQIVKIFRSDSLEGLSILTWSLAASQAVLWLIVSLHRQSYYIAAANTAAIAATLVMLLAYVYRVRRLNFPKTK